VVDLNRLAGRLNNERDAERVIEFAADVQALQKTVSSGATTSDVVMQLIDEIGLAGSVASLDANRRGMNRSAQGDDLTAITHLAALHDDPTDFERWLRSHLATRRSPDGVLLSTVHRVKGQEWPHVIVHLADAEQYPHRLADDVEEERRLFHVAVTRARQHATIVTGAHPSPFVAELTTEPSAQRPVVSSHRPEPVVRASSRSTSSGADPGRRPRRRRPDRGSRRCATCATTCATASRPMWCSTTRPWLRSPARRRPRCTTSVASPASVQRSSSATATPSSH
jgi:DNA helicase II / ATP-dependent DNA helicase PcrA